VAVSEGVDHRSLYLRWRPGRFADVLGQDHVTRTLRNAVAASQVAHAYLLCGPRGTGKTSIARILFKAMNCERPVDGDACGTCSSCADVATGRALDLVEIDAASNRGIDHIRDLREKVWISPSQVQRKMYILDEAHQLSAAAWDAFLKTLEEPPAHVVFVLATTEVHKVPATILSRCQRFDLGRISLVDLVDHLGKVGEAEGIRAEPAVLQRVARLSRGGVRDALSTLEQLVAYGGEELTLPAAREVLGLAAEESLQRCVEALARHEARAALELVGELAREGADLRQFLDDLVDYLRALLLVRLGASEALAFEFGADERAWLEGQAPAWRPSELVELVRRLSDVDPKGRDAGQLQVHLELALLDAALGRTGAVDQPVAAVRGAGSSPSVVHLVAPPAPGAMTAPAAVTPAAPPARAPLDEGPADPDDEGEGGFLYTDATSGVDAAGPGLTLTVREQPGAPEDGRTAAGPGPNGTAPPDAPDLALIRHRWTELKEAIAAQLPGGAGIALEAATVVDLRAGELMLAFTSDIFQPTIEKDDCRETIRAVTAQYFGVALTPRCVIGDAYQPTLPDDAFLKEAVDLFGATGVEPVGEA
jgi:DNA polymerase III subunit gamma/tau